MSHSAQELMDRAQSHVTGNTNFFQHLKPIVGHSEGELLCTAPTGLAVETPCNSDAELLCMASTGLAMETRCNSDAGLLCTAPTGLDPLASLKDTGYKNTLYTHQGSMCI